MKNAVIWGVGMRGKLSYTFLRNSYNMIGWVDNDHKKQGLSLEGLPVYSPAELAELCDKKTLIAICNAAYKEIKRQLNVMGFTNVIISDLHLGANWSRIIKGFLFDSDAVSYSAWGEDLIVDAVFRALGIVSPKYAEIGVEDPIINSNTYLFYERGGGNGILVEADPRCDAKIRNYRFNDRYFPVGLGKTRGDFQLYTTGKDRGLSTFEKQISNLWHDFILGDEAVSVIVPVMTFDDIFLDECIQYVSIDIDGWDEEVICSIGFDNYPELLVMVSETVCNRNVRQYMLAYGFVYFASTRDNEIYIRESILPTVLEYYECQRIYELMKFIDSKESSWLL